MTLAPAISRSFPEGRLTLLDQVADPDGTRIVSPLAAALTQSSTSCRPALAAVRVGLEPEQAAAAGSANAHTASVNMTARISPVINKFVIVIVVLSSAVASFF
jgi:hypothetical protein